MAAVTVNNNPPQRHVLGDVAIKYFNISGASGNTLATGMNPILFIEIQQSNANGVISAITAVSNNAGTLTFTSSGAMSNEIVAVTGQKNS
jgi:hypothetical protein